MNRTRLMVAALTVALLALLFGWQLRRDQLVKACIDNGGVWHGPRSACRAPLRPLLQRDLQRS